VTELSDVAPEPQGEQPEQPEPEYRDDGDAGEVEPPEVATEDEQPAE
jgi:hypothetical protein